ncbi:MAG: gamma-glutamylcyclotransferase, partial [Gammaproteobacteria bacterium]|nr:gamma-glutamylcyclotransferase [Gammaproteobacteria bacterium]
MWNPGFPYLESTRARIFGLHRSLCIRSIRYRGTREQPGLVFGLDRGGSCAGMGYLIAPENQREVAEYLQDRELLND